MNTSMHTDADMYGVYERMQLHLHVHVHGSAHVCAHVRVHKTVQ